ncbi:MAG: DUF4266 domain-containing protein [Planctomycetes bacterium]|nr:DUF4266 domain-containing protein [Planctomycetota bacterium]
MHPSHPRRGNRRLRSPLRLSPGCLLLASLSLTSCESVPFYDKGMLASALMSFDESSPDDHAQQKVFYSREASTGGIGSKAGGGCGCTN